MYHPMPPFGQPKKDAPPPPPPPVHVPIEPSGQNPEGTILFRQGSLPSSCWVVWTDVEGISPQFPSPQFQVMTSVDYLKIIETACADLAETTRLKIQKRYQPPESNGAVAKAFMSPQMLMAEKLEREAFSRSLAMLNNSGAPSPSLSISPISMSPRASNDR